MVFSEKVFPENPWDKIVIVISTSTWEIFRQFIFFREKKKKKTKWQELLKEGKYI